MGIVNLTPDSFFEGSRAQDTQDALDRIADWLRSGATIVDLGAVSTRPGAPDISLEEEWGRLEPVLEKLPELLSSRGASGCAQGDIENGGTAGCAHGDSENGSTAGYAQGDTENGGDRTWENSEALPAISIDTTRAEIVRRAYGVIGMFIVNDISAGEDDPQMLQTVAQLGLPYVAMHKRGNPRTMDAMVDYPGGITRAVTDYFREFEKKAREVGIENWILDPGFGFAKTREQNIELFENLQEFRQFGRPILVGVADKRFTRDEDGTSHSREYELRAIQMGADIIRTHTRF